MFGGKLKWRGDPIAETTILRFGEEVVYTALPFGEYEILKLFKSTEYTVPTFHRHALLPLIDLKFAPLPRTLQPPTPLALLTHVVAIHRLEVCLLLPRTFTVCDWTPH